jgi:hypothetical protein
MRQQEFKGVVRGNAVMVMGRSGLSAGEWPPTAWFPTPVQTKARGSRPSPKYQTLSSLALSASREGLGEKLLMALLSGIALVAIAYGFLALVNSVQHWAFFQNYVAQLTQ